MLQLIDFALQLSCTRMYAIGSDGESHMRQTKKRATPDIFFAPSDLEEEKRREKRTFEVNG
jgi:hypothetical protein